ncbi:MAG: hypothetical protein IJN41_01845, partial [Firmicutes bacterium]|nr:hypothetical protein [Bacillota bacterium]
DYTDEMKCAEESEEPEQGKISIVANGNDYRASWTGFDNVSRFAYALVDQNNKMVSMQWLNEGVTVSNDFRMFLPLTESGTATYDFVLYEVIDNKTGEVLGRIEDAFEVTASGSPLSYDMEFAHKDYVEGSYTAKYNTITWKGDAPTGIWAIGAWFRNNNQYTRNVGTISSPSMDYIHQIQEGDVFDLRVVTAYELDGQTLKATITPESKKKYTVETGELVDQKNGYDIEWSIENHMLNAKVIAPEGTADDTKVTIWIYKSGTNDYTSFGNVQIGKKISIWTADGEYDRVKVFTALAHGSSYEGETPLADWALEKKIVANVGNEEFPISDVTVDVKEKDNDEGYTITLGGLDFTNYAYELYNEETLNSVILDMTGEIDDPFGDFIGNDVQLSALYGIESDNQISIYQSKPILIDIVGIESSEPGLTMTELGTPELKTDGSKVWLEATAKNIPAEANIQVKYMLDGSEYTLTVGQSSDYYDLTDGVLKIYLDQSIALPFGTNTTFCMAVVG